MKLLFICQENRLRSATAEAIYRGRPGLEVRSAGVAPTAVHQVTVEDLHWADLIVVMEGHHELYLRQHCGDVLHQKRLVCLHIPDRYHYMDGELVQLLEERLAPHLNDEPRDSSRDASSNHDDDREWLF